MPGLTPLRGLALMPSLSASQRPSHNMAVTPPHDARAPHLVLLPPRSTSRARAARALAVLFILQKTKMQVLPPAIAGDLVINGPGTSRDAVCQRDGEVIGLEGGGTRWRATLLRMQTSHHLTYVPTSWLKDGHKGEGISCWRVSLYGILIRARRGYCGGILAFSSIYDGEPILVNDGHEGAHRVANPVPSQPHTCQCYLSARRAEGVARRAWRASRSRAPLASPHLTCQSLAETQGTEDSLLLL
ncbi:hypothetical protein Efla_000746 [Eimeria flavescens]